MKRALLLILITMFVSVSSIVAEEQIQNNNNESGILLCASSIENGKFVTKTESENYSSTKKFSRSFSKFIFKRMSE